METTLPAILLFCLTAAADSPAIVEPKGLDSQGIAAAVARAQPGDTVRLPEGTFELAEPVRPKSGIKLLGAGQERTRLVCKGVKPGVFISLDGCEDVEIAQMTLDGRNNPLVHQGISGSDSRRLWLHHLTIRDLKAKTWGPHAILFSGRNPSMEGGVTDSRITDCRIENIGLEAEYGGGIRLAWGSARNQVLGNVIHNTGRGGIFGDHSAELIIRNNRVSGSGGEGLGIEIWGGCPRSLIEDNVVDHWLSVDQGHQSAVRRNVVGADDGSLKFLGIEIIARDVVVTDNVVKRGAHIGLSVSNKPVKNNVYWGYNTVRDCAQWGAQFQGETGGIAHHYFYRCAFENTVLGHSKARYPQDSGHGFRTNGSCRGLVFEDCVFRNNGGYGVQLGGRDVDSLDFLRSAITGNRQAAVVGPAQYTALEFTGCKVEGNKGDQLPAAKPFSSLAPVADFRLPEPIRAGEPVQFQCTSHAACGIAERLWDFGDGIPEVTDQPRHTFGQPGKYRVTLVVWDKSGRGGRAEKMIRVALPRTMGRNTDVVIPMREITSVADGDYRAVDAVGADMRSEFARPPFEYKPRPLWFWNAPLEKAQIDAVMEGSKQSGYSGFGILPSPGMKPAYLSDEYFARYGDALKKAAQLGQKLTLYDEFWFPSGYAGGKLAEKYPDALCKRLDMLAEQVAGPTAYEKRLPAGRLMGIVAMHDGTQERKDLTAEVREGVLRWQAPEGNWKIMIFTCVPDGARGLVDYLDPDAVRRFVELTHEQYFKRFPDHFGTTIDGAFYDEPTFHWVQGGRAWTGEFNRKFREKHGSSPVLWYPALWLDIGPDTAAARNALFGFRAELYATGFPKVLQDWCAAHRIRSTGHVDQEEVVNPVGLCGDLMKSFQHQEVPGLDSIFQFGRGSPMYKIISSAAYNYDRPLVMTEVYGAMGEGVGVTTLYKEAMDELAKGVNLFVPHAIWLDNDKAKVVAPPELSYRSAAYGPALPALNDYLGRAARILRHGRHVADIGVLYPIATLQAGYRFDAGKPYEGGVIPAEADYMQVGELLALAVRRDYTFIHPEVLDRRCAVAGKTIELRNKNNPEQYRVFVVPGSTTIHWSNLCKLQEFYDAGGRIVATTRLPDKSAEFGKDAEVRQAVQHVFGPGADAGADKPTATALGYTMHSNANGGRAYFVAKPSAASLKAALDDARGACDVQWETDPQVAGGNLSYIHKVVDGTDVYFFANSSDTAVDAHVRIRGKHALELWDPHTGDIRKAEYTQLSVDGQEVTRVRLVLPRVKSIFIVGR